jgi:hypothetical protein
MKFLAYIVALLVSPGLALALPGDPVITSMGMARTFFPLNLMNQCYLLTGTVNPTTTPVNAPMCSMYLSTNGNAYVKQDSGSSTNWNMLSAASGSFLPLAGGTMTGNIYMGNNAIGNISTLALGETSPQAGAIIDIVNNTGSTQRIIQTGYGGNVGTRNRYANGTISSPTAATTGNTLGFVSAQGYGTSSWPSTSTGIINFLAQGTFTNSSMPTAIGFSVTPSGSTTAAQAMEIAPTGDVLIGTTTDSGTQLLQVNGNSNVGTVTQGVWNGTGITVAYGGTGQTSLTSGAVLVGNGTSAVSQVSPGSSGNVLTSNGSTWVSQAPSGGGAYVVSGSTGSPNLITTSGVTAGSAQRQMIFVATSGGAVTVTANPQISAGTVVGQELVVVGTSASNYPVFNDGSGLSLNGVANLTNNAVLNLFWDGSVWHEQSRR